MYKLGGGGLVLVGRLRKVLMAHDPEDGEVQDRRAFDVEQHDHSLVRNPLHLAG